MTTNNLAGVYAAAVTPLTPEGTPDLEAIPAFLDFLAQRGCHGILLLGTTGEGPSFSPQERQDILRAALRIREQRPDLRLLAGTGTPSLTETIDLTRKAFDLGIDGVVVLPPYYYRKVGDSGLVDWFGRVIASAVPAGGALLGYHIPQVSGVPLSLTLLASLVDRYPGRFRGLKDSSGDADHARQLGDTFGADLLILNGNDQLFSQALGYGAAGCITAPANLFSPYLRQVWEAAGQDPTAQQALDQARQVLDRYQPAASILKGLLHTIHHLPLWPVRPPLEPHPAKKLNQALAELEAAGLLYSESEKAIPPGGSQK